MATVPSIRVLERASYYSQHFEIPLSVILSVCQIESAFEPDMVGGCGERGLMQITEIALEDVNTKMGWTYKPEELFDVDVNIKVGVVYLSICANIVTMRLEDDIEEREFWKRVVATYNCGIGRSKRKPYPESTQAHLVKFAKAMEAWSGETV